MGLFDFLKRKKQWDGTYVRPTENAVWKEEYGRTGYGSTGEDNTKNNGTGEGNIEFGLSGSGDTAPFHMTVEDVFTITGRGTVVTGKVASGFVVLGDTVRLRRVDQSSRYVTICGIEMFRKMMDVARQGDNVGLLLRGVGKNEVGRGDVLEKL